MVGKRTSKKQNAGNEGALATGNESERDDMHTMYLTVNYSM